MRTIFAKRSTISKKQKDGAKILLKEVEDADRFGVAEIRGDRIVGIGEKPKKPKSNYAVVGIYHYDSTVFQKICRLKPSGRGGLEITDVNNFYIDEGKLTYEIRSQLMDKEKGVRSLATIDGIYNMTAEGQISWYEFAKAILEEVSATAQSIPWVRTATKGMPFLVERVVPVTTAEYPTPARRPAYSVLSTRRLHDQFGVRLPPWRAQLRSLFILDFFENSQNF